MIASDQELKTTQNRIMQFQQILGQLRASARPEEYLSVVSGYRQELERMHDEVLKYPQRSTSEA